MAQIATSKYQKMKITICTQVFLDGERATAYLTEDTKDKLVQGVAFKITGLYHEVAAGIVNTVKKHEIMEKYI